MLIPLSIVDDVAIFDLGQQEHHPHNNMLPVYVLFDSRTMSHNHPQSSSSGIHHQPLPFHSHNRNVSSTPTASVLDETVLYGSPRGNYIPRRSRIHPTWSVNHHTGPRRHHNSTRASPAVVMGVQDTSQHVTTSSTTTDAESVCCICLVDFSSASSTPIQLPCSHVFHADCIQKWVNIRKTCPLCRANV